MERHSQRAQPVSPERTAELVAIFQSRLAYMKDSYVTGRLIENAFPSYNEGLKLLAKAVNPRAHRSKARQRLHPLLEMVVSDRARQIHAAAGCEPGGRPTPSEVLEASKQVAAELKPVRGRHLDALLEHHVHGLMVLFNETSGVQVRASITKNSVYDRRMASTAGELIEQFFRSIDPSIHKERLAGIVYKATRTRAVQGKRFSDLFPHHGRTAQEIAFNPNYPIYCS